MDPAVIEASNRLYGEEDDDVEDDDLNSPSPSIDNLNSPSLSTTSSSSDQNPSNPVIYACASSDVLSGGVPLDPTPISSIPAVPQQENKRLRLAPTIDDSRRIFQRLWTDKDEIGLLQGFLDYTSQRGRGRGVFHHDTAPFYEQIKARLQLDFNKNQLVEKLRRLKKKYRTIVSRIGSGMDFVFKSPHEQATFEISRKIWGNVGSSGPLEDVYDGNTHDNTAVNKVPRSRRSAKKLSDGSAGAPAQATAAAAMGNHIPSFSRAVPTAPTSVQAGAGNPNICNVFEDTVKSCLAPLFKELLNYAINGPSSSAVGGVALNPLPFNFNGNAGSVNSDERWRKQQILELEVYLKRLELVQEQIKSSLEKLRSLEN